MKIGIFKPQQLFFTGTILVIWLIFMTYTNQWQLFLEEPICNVSDELNCPRTFAGFLVIKNWFMTVTMLFGSFIAGATAEGGGAVAFPVMTLLFDIKPAIARNFSFAIQSCGMTAAAYLIFVRKIPIEKTYLILCSIGGTFGIILGSYAIVPLVTPAYAKMFFVSLWLSFGVVLFYLNCVKQRKVVEKLPNISTREKISFIFLGIIGGIVSAIVGSGIDICTFSFVTTRYNLSEKIATPTSVCLMAGNTVIGFLTHTWLIKDFGIEEFHYWLVAIPVVIFFAPIGAYFISNKTREFVAGFLYLVLIVQFIGAWLIIQPHQNPVLLAFSVAVFCGGLTLFLGFRKTPKISQ